MAKLKFKTLFLFLILLVVFTSCKQQDFSSGIAVWLQVDTITFSLDYIDHGTSKQKITDVWVYADNQTIGTFEMPSTIPILKSGTVKLRFEAGIKLNGITSTRVPNPFFEPIIVDEFNFVPDSISLANFGTEYQETTVFVWEKDFEGKSISIDSTSISKTKILLSAHLTAETFEGTHSGKIVLTGEEDYYEGASYEAFDLPTAGSVVFIEMHYKCKNILVVGLFAWDASQIIQDPIIYLLPQDDWNKIYVNFTNKL